VQARLLNENEKTGAAIVSAAKYEITNLNITNEKVKELLNADCINVTKKGKKGKQDTIINIRPLIYDAHISDDTLFLTLAAGPNAYLKPEVVVSYLAEDKAAAAFYLRTGLLDENMKELIQA